MCAPSLASVRVLLRRRCYMTANLPNIQVCALQCLERFRLNNIVGNNHIKNDVNMMNFHIHNEQCVLINWRVAFELNDLPHIV